MNWVNMSDKFPPIDRPFLANTPYGVEMMKWFQNGEKGWFSLYGGCSCCNGHCSATFVDWMPLPAPPSETEDKE